MFFSFIRHPSNLQLPPRTIMNTSITMKTSTPKLPFQLSGKPHHNKCLYHFSGTTADHRHLLKQVWKLCLKGYYHLGHRIPPALIIGETLLLILTFVLFKNQTPRFFHLSTSKPDDTPKSYKVSDTSERGSNQIHKSTFNWSKISKIKMKNRCACSSINLKP